MNVNLASAVKTSTGISSLCLGLSHRWHRCWGQKRKRSDWGKESSGTCLRKLLAKIIYHWLNPHKATMEWRWEFIPARVNSHKISLLLMSPFSASALTVTVHKCSPDHITRLQQGGWPIRAAFPVGENNLQSKVILWVRCGKSFLWCCSPTGQQYKVPPGEDWQGFTTSPTAYYSLSPQQRLLTASIGGIAVALQSFFSSPRCLPLGNNVMCLVLCVDL